MSRRSLFTAVVVAVVAISGTAQGRGGGGMGGGGGGGMGGGGCGGGGCGGGGAGTALTTFATDDFSGSGNCAMCHSGRTDSVGQDVSMDRQWRSTMMANSAKDPLWQAKISSEVVRNPALREIIEDKCSRCHTPMARVQAIVQGSPVAVLDEGFLDAAHPLHPAAMDGVSCSLCHQISAQNLGQPASFTGNYTIDTTTSSPYRWIYGTFSQPFQSPMQMHVGFVPVQRMHVKDSGYCGSCHTLYTPIVDAQGGILGEFPEQTPYLEWKHSDFSAAGNATHCQDCHMPDGPGTVALSNRPHWLSARSQVGQHTLVGGNRLLLDILQAHTAELGVTAEAAHLGATAALTVEQLAQSTAQLSIVSQKVENNTLTMVLQVSNLAGHKFPTGVPIRRAWLHVRVTDKRGRLVFESGAPWSDGRIAGNDADNDAEQFEPHYDVITAADQVQIYETIMRDSAGRATWTFLSAAGYLKDNRLLPRGFEKINADSDIAVYGAASGDQNFTGGGDTVTYRIDISRVAQAQRPVQFTARLLYQSVGRRFMEDLRRDATEQVRRFAGYFDAADKTPVEIAAVP